MDITDGINYHVMPGKHTNSKVIVHSERCYLIDKTEKNAKNETVYYVKCKVPSCPARGHIKQKKFAMSDKFQHDCDQNSGAHIHKIVIQDVLNRMKDRAQSEGTSYFVSLTINTVIL